MATIQTDIRQANRKNVKRVRERLENYRAAYDAGAISEAVVNAREAELAQAEKMLAAAFRHVQVFNVVRS